MNVFKLSLAFMLVIGISGCSRLSWSEQMSRSDMSENVAELVDYQVNDGFITIQAVGYGCTFINSFRVEVASRKDNSIAVVRTLPDLCRMKPRNVSLQYSFKHLGLDLQKSIKVTNPIDETGMTSVVTN